MSGAISRTGLLAEHVAQQEILLQEGRSRLVRPQDQVVQAQLGAIPFKNAKLRNLPLCRGTIGPSTAKSQAAVEDGRQYVRVGDTAAMGSAW